MRPRIRFPFRFFGPPPRSASARHRLGREKGIRGSRTWALPPPPPSAGGAPVAARREGAHSRLRKAAHQATACLSSFFPPPPRHATPQPPLPPPPPPLPLRHSHQSQARASSLKANCLFQSPLNLSPAPSYSAHEDAARCGSDAKVVPTRELGVDLRRGSNEILKYSQLAAHCSVHGSCGNGREVPVPGVLLSAGAELWQGLTAFFLFSFYHP